MKRKLVIMGDERLMMKEVFDISDHDVDEAKRFLEKDYDYIFDVIKEAIKSNLNEKQKMLIAYIAGNTNAMMSIDNMKRMEVDCDDNTPIAG